MLLHRIGQSVGTAIRGGRTLYGYKARCGANIIAAGPMAIGATMAVGPEPHAHCGRCFVEKSESIDVKLPDGSLGGDVYDEMGRLTKASTEKEDFTAPLRDSNAGKTEDFPYGAPIRRQ